MKRLVIAAACAAVLATGLVASPAASAPIDPREFVMACTGPGGNVTGGGFEPMRVTTSYGLDFTIDNFNPSWWSTNPTGSLRQGLDLYSQSWLLAAMNYAMTIGDSRRVEKTIQLAQQSLAAYPDNGQKQDFQWNEGTNSWRLCALATMYQLSADPRLIPVVEAAVRANLDPQRYYGLPNYTPHNHGVTANMALMIAGFLLKRPEWMDAAKARIQADSQRWITSEGFGIEQSTPYMITNITFWNRLADHLELVGEEPDSPLVLRVRDIANRASQAVRHLRQPDGRIVAFGDADDTTIDFTAGNNLSIVDRGAGIAAGRWSWDRPDDYYAIRFGPSRRAHGHWEHGSMVWWALGRPILEDPGFDPRSSSKTQAWLRTAASHNTSRATGGTLNPRGTMQLLRKTGTATRPVFLLRGNLWGVSQDRSIAVDSAKHVLSVFDKAKVPQTQTWQLDERWQLSWVSRTRHSAVFTDGTGATAILRTSGLISGWLAGLNSIDGGWSYRYAGRTAAPRILVDSAKNSWTTWTVSGPPLTPWVVPNAASAG